MPGSRRGNTIGPPLLATAWNPDGSKRRPQRPPLPHCESTSHAAPSVGPPAHAFSHVPLGQSVSVVHASPSFELLLQRPRWFAIRSTVAGASAEPRSEMVFGAVAASGFVCGTKIGGNFAPSGVHEVSEDCEGIENGTSDLKVAESTRGF